VHDWTLRKAIAKGQGHISVKDEVDILEVEFASDFSAGEGGLE